MIKTVLISEYGISRVIHLPAALQAWGLITGLLLAYAVPQSSLIVFVFGFAFRLSVVGLASNVLVMIPAAMLRAGLQPGSNQLH